MSVRRHEGLIFVRADSRIDKALILKEISKVFGVASISPAAECESTMEDIGRTAVEYMKEVIEGAGHKDIQGGGQAGLIKIFL